MPTDNATANEIDATDQDHQCGKLTNASAGLTEEEVKHRHSLGKDTCFEGSQRRCRCNRIKGIIVCRGERGHTLGPCKHQKDASRKSRVHNVLTNAAKELLDKNNGECRAHYRYVERHRGGKIKAEQKACNGCGAVVNGDGTLEKKLCARLKKNCAYNSQKNDQSCTQAIDVNAPCCGGQQSNQNVLHNRGGRHPSPCVGRRRDCQERRCCRGGLLFEIHTTLSFLISLRAKHLLLRGCIVRSARLQDSCKSKCRTQRSSLRSF